MASPSWCNDRDSGGHETYPPRALHEEATVTAFLVFVCAGTSATGAGHLSRCLALADAYRHRGWRIEFIVSGDAFAELFGNQYRWHVAPSGQALDVLKTIAPG